MNGRGIVHEPLKSDDTEATLNCINCFNAETEFRSGSVKIKTEEPLRLESSYLNVGESGTLLRFLLPLVSVLPGPGEITLAGEGTLCDRSNREIVESLRNTGLKIAATGTEGTIPVSCFTDQDPAAQPIPVSCATTSQLLSGWLITLCALGGGELYRTTELVSAPYVTMTEKVLSEAGVTVDHPNSRDYVVSPGGSTNFNYTVPGDFSSASFFILAGSLTKGRLVVDGLQRDDPQADRKIVPLLRKLGANLTWEDSGVENSSRLVLENSFRPTGFRLDVSDCPDLVPILAVLGALAKGEAVIHNGEHLKNKESDRLNRTAEELRKAGFEVQTDESSLMVGGTTSDVKDQVTVNAHEDHRLAMAFSILGLLRGDLTVEGAECVSKSYPNFFSDLESLGGKFQQN